MRVEFDLPNSVVGKPLKRYLDSHLVRGGDLPNYPDHIRKVRKPILGFKKLKGNTIANLVIPKDSYIFYPDWHNRPHSYRDERKLRADRAFVHSIFKFDKVRAVLKRSRGRSEAQLIGEFREVGTEYSIWDSHFLYEKFSMVLPKNEFSSAYNDCASGIHFYLNIRDAYNHI